MSLSPAQVKEGVRVLYAYLAQLKKESKEKEKKLLFDDDPDIYVTVALKRTPDKQRVKPFRIPLKHSLYDREGVEICLLTKDPQRTYKDLLAAHPVKGVTKVIGVDKLRKKYIKYQYKRDLLASYQLFLADDRIIPLLPPLIGKKFFLKKKQPVPVSLKGTNFAKELQKARDSTYMYLGTGPCCAVRIAKASFSQEQVIDNVLHSINPIVEKLPKKWANVQAVFVKTHDSVALPVYTSLPIVQRIPANETVSGAQEKDSKKKKRKRVPPPVKEELLKESTDTSVLPSAVPKKQKREKTAKKLGDILREAVIPPAKKIKTTKKLKSQKRKSS